MAIPWVRSAVVVAAMSGFLIAAAPRAHGRFGVPTEPLAARFDAALQGSTCMSVTMAPSAAANTTVQANVSIAGCASNGVQFQGVFLNVQSSNAGVASALSSSVQFSSAGTATVQLSARTVTAPTPVTITFSTQLSGGPISTTRTLTVCQFQFDVAVTNVSLPQGAKPAGQTTPISVTVQNNGAQTLFVNSVHFQLATDPNTSDSSLSRTSCSTPPPTSTSFTGLTSDLAAGQTGTATLNFRFPQAGTFNLIATASISGAEDGPPTNNTGRGQATVALPKPLVCSAQPQSPAAGSPVTIGGNWFRKFGGTDTPTATIQGVNAPVTSVASPLQITVTMPDLVCSASGQTSIAVTTSGGTGTGPGPSLPAGPKIAAISPSAPCPGGKAVIKLSGLRNSCPRPTVHFGATELKVVATTFDTITVVMPPTVPDGTTALRVDTSYGSDTLNLRFAAPSITSTSLRTTPLGGPSTLTINVANFRADCPFTVTIEPRQVLNQPLAPGGTATLQVQSSTATTIVVGVVVARLTFQYTVKVDTGYGTGSANVILGPSSIR